MCELHPKNKAAILKGGRHDCMINVVLHSYGEAVMRLHELDIELTEEQLGDIEELFIDFRELLLSME
jgi:hypothetical protein